MKSSAHIVYNSQELIAYLHKINAESNVSLSKIKLSETNDWSIDNGVLSHKSRGFFHVTGIKNVRTNRDRIILYQPQSAVTGLIFHKDKSHLYLLLQARLEPGNTNFAQYGPTIQSTPANYLQHHGGNKTHYAQLFLDYSDYCNLVATSYQFDLGKRYYQKSKTHIYLQAKKMFKTDETMIWASWSSIYELLAEDNVLNSDLRSLISVFDWKKLTTSKVNTKATFSSSEISFYEALRRKNTLDWQLISLNTLSKYKINDTGITTGKSFNPAISYYRFSTKFREMSSWSQPLLSVERKGLVVLLTRNIGHNRKEFLVTVKQELGISGNVTVLPTIALYPEEASSSNRQKALQQIQPAILCSEFTQCDEGGRFINHEHEYRIYTTTSEIKPTLNQYWISQELLKNILQSSCTASFQLRVICSSI